MSPTADPSLLDVQGLSMRYASRSGDVRAIDAVSLAVGANETLGLVGESGCGKSSVGFTLMRLLPANGRIVSGKVLLDGVDIVAMHEDELNTLRWSRVAMVFQSAMNALNPVLTVEDQITEAMLQHGTEATPAAAAARAAELFTLVGLPRERLRNYPHEFSGGMRQRAVIAMSLACRPRLLIADEPTTALDVVVQDQIFLRLRRLRRDLRIGMLLISHDIGVIAANCDRVAVMYGGRIVEQGPVAEIVSRPRHPYTMLLMQATPRVFGTATPLASLPGAPPALTQDVTGCIFAHRCLMADARCHDERPAPRMLGPAHEVQCHYAGELSPSDLAGKVPTFVRAAAPPADAPTLVAFEAVSKQYTLNTGMVAALLGRHRYVTAVNGIDLNIRRGEALGLVGESGCGKTTTGYLLSALESVTSGTFRFEGQDVTGFSQGEMRRFRRRVQVIFQDPYESINPRMSIFDLLVEPLTIHAIGADASERAAMVETMMQRVGLTPVAEFAQKMPSQLSGGQRQRVAIARAMIVGPNLVVADEPVSMLDASVKAGIMSLIKDFKQDGVTFLIITHDLSVARYLCDRVAVMYLGDIVELGLVDSVIADPKHPYTRVLLDAVYEPDTAAHRVRVEVEGEPPNAADRPPGCPFHPRCPQAMAECKTEVPPIRLVEDRRIACLLYRD